MNLKDIILASADIPAPQKVCVKEWGTDVYIKHMSGSERDKWEADAFEAGKVTRQDFRARYLVHCLVDEKGEAIFSAEDIPALGSKSGKVIDRLYSRAQKINALSKEDEDEILKN